MMKKKYNHAMKKTMMSKKTHTRITRVMKIIKMRNTEGNPRKRQKKEETKRMMMRKKDDEVRKPNQTRMTAMEAQ